MIKNIVLFIGLCISLSCGFSDVQSGPYTNPTNEIGVSDPLDTVDSVCMHDQVMEDIYFRFNDRTWNAVYSFLRCGKAGSHCINFPVYTQERIADYITQAACCPFRNPKTTTQSRECIECILNNINTIASNPDLFNTGLADLIKDCK